MKPLFGQSWNIRHLPGHLTLREIYRALRLYKGEQQDLLRVIMAAPVVVSNMLLNTLQWDTLHQRRTRAHVLIFYNVVTFVVDIPVADYYQK